ncbi:MAG: TetR/AcrR family transcriptional regulator [Eggerthellaceae bacterium]|nr:TetR/AcrR family transcriptional regulator [Eggerthellaceae bacterium]
MYITPKDSRQRYTKACLTEAFLSALETKPVSAVSVSSICEAAGISRKTFYKYYSDQFALLQALQEDLFIGFAEELKALPANIFDITPALIAFIGKHRVLVRVAFENWSAEGFIDRIIRHLYQSYHSDWEAANPQMTRKEVAYLFQYVVVGLIGVIRFWLIDAPETPPDEVVASADYLMRLTTPK